MDLVVEGSDGYVYNTGQIAPGNPAFRSWSIVDPMDKAASDPSAALLSTGCACRETRPCSSSGMSILVDDSAETVPSAYGQAFDLVGLKRLGPGSQRCGSSK